MKQISIKKNVLKAIYNYKLFDKGDKIIVALSGGKDSFTLLEVLQKIRNESALRHNFKLVGVYIQPGNNKIKNLSKEISKICNKLDIEFISQQIKISKDSKLQDGLDKLETCQRCAYARRITLFKTAEQIGANKIAYGHHMDDIITTLIMNIQYTNKLQAMSPINKMKRGNLDIIRPLSKVREKQIIGYIKNHPFIKPLDNNCPLKNENNREKVQNKIQRMESQDFPNFVNHLYKAYMKKFDIDDLINDINVK